MIIIGITFLISAELLLPILRPYRSHSLPFSNGFFFGMSFLMIIYVLSRKVYQYIKIDYEKNTVEISYITLFKNNCITVIDFEKLEYNYKKIASRTGGKWKLKLWKDNKCVMNLEENDYGFEKEKLDLIVEKLKELE